MAEWLNLGQSVKVRAKTNPDRVSFQDAQREFTYEQTNRRANILANRLVEAGLEKTDRLAVIMENSIEMAELFIAVAKTGIVIVPVNFRLAGPEIEYILKDSGARAVVADDEFAPEVDGVRRSLSGIKPGLFIVNGIELPGWRTLEKLFENGDAAEPEADVRPEDTWIHIYTSGTTGKPKGVVRSHESHIAFYLINAVEFGFSEHDKCLNVMPLCHINSTFYTFTFTYIGGSAYIHPARSFKPHDILDIIEAYKITFISLIPTHYNLILNLSEDQRKKDVSSVKKLLCSSAPARKQTKTEVMEFFKGVELYEAYGSTEAGIVTVLKPEYQLRKLGSIGYEVAGADLVKLLDDQDKPVGPGKVGELYSKGPMLFDGYFNLPEKTADSFRDGWFSAGDMAIMDEDGFFTIVDRKDNMIITGGENVYPSEVEEAVAAHDAVFDCACIGVPDDKWGEKVVAAVTLKPGYEKQSVSGDEIRVFCRDKIAGYKIPKQVFFLDDEEMPRTATGKILHRKLREKFFNV